MSVAWSFTRLIDFENCAKRYREKYIIKSIPFIKNAAMIKGQEVHDDAEEAVKRARGDKCPGFWEPLIEVERAMPLIAAFVKGHSQVLVEQELAFNERLQPVSWFDKAVWFRVKIDLLGLCQEYASNIDWKTGKVRMTEDQLQLYNIAALLKHPTCDFAKSVYVWLDHPGAPLQVVSLARDDLDYALNGYGERAEAINTALRSGNWPATKCFQCKWCQIPCEFGVGVPF